MDIGKMSEIMGPFFDAVARDAAGVMATLRLAPDANILDVGTGEGQFAIFLAASGYRVLTGEPAPDSSRYAGRNWQERAVKIGVRDKIRSISFTAEEMPFPQKCFDAVFFFGVLHHIDEKLRKNAFGEAMRVTKDNGVVVFFEPNNEALAKVRVKDPEHPDAACPSDYASGFKTDARTMAGSFMDAFIFARQRH